jgi:hypothetical protein
MEEEQEREEDALVERASEPAADERRERACVGR